MIRKISYVRLQTPVHFPGAGELGNILPPAVKVLPGLSMYSHGADGVIVKFLWQGKPFEVWIPSANVALAVLEPEGNVKVADLATDRSWDGNK